MTEFESAWMSEAARRWPRQFAIAHPSAPPSVLHAPGWVPLAEALFDRVEAVLEDTDSTLAWTRCENKRDALCLEFEIAGDCHLAVIGDLVDSVELQSESVCARCGSERRTTARADDQGDTCYRCGGPLYRLDEVLGSLKRG